MYIMEVETAPALGKKCISRNIVQDACLKGRARTITRQGFTLKQISQVLRKPKFDVKI